MQQGICRGIARFNVNFRHLCVAVAVANTYELRRRACIAELSNQRAEQHRDSLLDLPLR